MRENYQRGLASKLILSVKHDAIAWNADVVKNALIWKFVSKIAYRKPHPFRSFMRCGQDCIKIEINSVVSINSRRLWPSAGTRYGFSDFDFIHHFAFNLV